MAGSYFLLPLRTLSVALVIFRQLALMVMDGYGKTVSIMCVGVHTPLLPAEKIRLDMTKCC
jgi:hypothetical protein